MSASSSSSENNQHDWEYSKENAAPLECGRSTNSLSKRAFGTSTAEILQIEEKTKKYERLVKRSEKAVEWMQKQATKVIEQNDNNTNKGGAAMERELTTDEAESLRTRLVLEIGFNPTTTDRDNVDYDPMRYWVLYIKHIRESYPSDSQKQFLLMERCARTFLAQPLIIPTYQNDVRFIRTCILYADKTSNPSEVFKLMSKIKVGTRVALFWVAWAWVAEKAQDFAFTEKIFQKALSVGAEPKQFLEERQRQFLRRMSRHWLNASKVDEDELEEDEEDHGASRGALNALSSDGVARNDRVSSRHSTQQQQQQQHQATASFRDSSKSTLHRIKEENKPIVGFNIFQDGDNDVSRDVLDEDDENDLRGAQRMARESERTKENTQRAEMWNERGHGLINTSSSEAAGSDSIVGTSYGRPPPAGGHQRSGSAAPFSFEVFVDDEFADENAPDTHNSTTEQESDQRSLRQRLDGGAAERLTRDPLRYMKNPSKLESDQIKYDSLPPTGSSTAASTSDDRPEEKNRASKPDPKESKAPVSRGFDKQLLKSDSLGQECCFLERRLYGGHYKLASTEDNFNLLRREEERGASSSRMDTEDSAMNIDTSIEDVDMEDDTQEIFVPASKPMKSVLKSSLRNRNTDAVMSEEENTGTINPRKVLQFGANTNVVYTNASVDTSTASSQLNSSFVPVEETINTKLANAEISMMFSSPNANASMAEMNDKSLLASSFKQPMFSTSRKKGAFDDDDDDFVKPKPSKLEPGLLNFSIYQEDDEEEIVEDQKKGGGLSFAIHEDGKQETCSTLNFSYSATASKLPDFSIYQEEDDRDSKQAKTKAPLSQPATSGEDTASLSVLDGILGGDEPKGFDVYSDHEPPVKETISNRCTSRSMASRGRVTRKMASAVEDTANLSLINGVMDSLENCSVNKPSSFEPVGMKFEIFSDNSSDSSQKKHKTKEPCFGDISMIEDEKTSNFQIMDENAASASSSTAIDYLLQHRDDLECAMRKCLSSAAKSRSQYEIFDYRKKSMPKALLKKSFTSGTNIELSRGESLIIVNELGRGACGVVLLCNDESDNSDALKIQAPIGSLAHEYSLLLHLEDRIEPDACGFYPFPRSRALYAYSEGGLFSMTAGSDSGMNIIDVVNTYKKITGNVPELIAIYYTSRMLKHLEALHLDGKVLHCDVKPDNWVLTSSSKDRSDADLMLVDFGRSVDLERVARRGSDPLKTQFKGSIAAEDMECVAMRKGLSWGVDLDFYGIAASSFLLLFGSHMEVTQDRSTGKWRPHKSFRRYWQRELWTLLFDTLLNFDSSTDKYAVGDIRIAFDEYMNEKDIKREITSHLSQLYTHLPKRR